MQVAAERAPLLAEAHYLHSLLLLEAGQPDAALTALYPQLDNKALCGYMQQALFISDLLGQA